MKTDSTIATMAAVTPKQAMASRSHTTWQRSAQKPETTKKTKNHRSPGASPSACAGTRAGDYRARSPPPRTAFVMAAKVGNNRAA